MIHSAFLSHTSELTDGGFVDAANSALRRAGWLSVEMAEYPAVDLEPAYYDAEKVADADIYVGIIGFDYGTQVTGRDVSYTEHEFDTATRLDKYRVLLLQLKPDGKVPDKKQLEFRRKVKGVPAIHMTFQTPDELELKLYHALLESRDRIEAHRARALRLRSLRGVRTPVDFTPRDWLTGKIDEFLKGGPSGYFFIEGKTGVGKSTLIAHLAKTHGWATHVVSDERQSRSTAVALQRLADQLIDRYELDELRTTEVRETGLFAEVLAQAAAAKDEKDQVVLLVDGLEQADDVRPMPFGLPAALPDGVYVVAAMREGFEVIGAGRDRRYGRTVIDPYGPEALVDVRNHIEAVLRTDALLSDRVKDKATFTETLVRKCAGVWVYLSRVLDGIRDGTIDPEEVPNLPLGLWSFYSRTFDELAGSHFAAALPAISTLACTAEPVDLDTLVTLAGVEDKVQVRALMTGPLRNFVQITKADDPLYSVDHDSLRNYFTGQRPQDDMTGDFTRIDQLRTAAHDTHLRIVRHYWPSDAALKSLDDGYGLRNLVVHLENAGRQEDVYRLLALEDGTSNLWFSVHDKHGALNEYREDLAHARRLAVREADQEINAGRSSRAVVREIACALMEASVESLTANITPNLLRALVESRLWWPKLAIGRIRAVRDRNVRMDLLEALLQARYPNGKHCLSEEDAAGLWDLVSPLKTGRNHVVAGLLLPRLPAEDRTAKVEELLPLALDPNSPAQSWIWVTLAGALDEEQLDRCVASALEIRDPWQRYARVLPALVPHVSVATLRTLMALPPAPGFHILQDALVTRLVRDGLEPAYVDEYLVDVLYGLNAPDPARVPVRPLFDAMDTTRRQSLLRRVLEHVARSRDWTTALKLEGLSEFLEGDAVDIAVRIARGIDPRNLPGARALALAALVRARPELAPEALRALPPEGSSDDHKRAETLELLTPHVGNARSGAEAIATAARHRDWRRAEVLKLVAPRLNHEERLAALALAAECELPEHRLAVLDALTEGPLDQEELELALRVMQRVGDEQPRAAAIAALAGQGFRSDRPALTARALELLETCAGPGRADVLIALGMLREAVAHLPLRPEAWDHGFVARLAAVRPVLTDDEVLTRLLDTFSVSYPDVALDVWAALAPPGSLSDKHWRAAVKAVKNCDERVYSRFLAVGAPHLEKEKEIRKAFEQAVELPPPYRALPTATIAARLKCGVMQFLSQEDFAELDAPTTGALARTMTEPELEWLLQWPLKVEALAAVLPSLSAELKADLLAHATIDLRKFVMKPDADFGALARQADASLLVKMLQSVSHLQDGTKARMREAVLGAVEPDAESWRESPIGPLRELFADLGRPGAMVVLAAGARHVACAVGMEAVADVATVVDDVARWWP
ncbi:DUF4062 domain-containing protein [Lentzea sp. BCCO 10_0856]|uniref:DUF4062 domain-containing protein n=1 Tax=Lentzea miocenica TaxID=3095431 RepID=A0ABU4T383_9PSEU|nr:DUF4062 domain-containing protein [Lentzea sp. BCCO 10_0856]MDX8032560.1 DUF4062 domain-containing protein [Lentzea sp. BCCO 10_0856]